MSQSANPYQPPETPEILPGGRPLNRPKCAIISLVLAVITYAVYVFGLGAPFSLMMDPAEMDSDDMEPFFFVMIGNHVGMAFATAALVLERRHVVLGALGLALNAGPYLYAAYLISQEIGEL